MPPPDRRRPIAVALAIHVALALGLSFVPLLGVLGFERAFVTGLVAPPVAAYLTVAFSRARDAPALAVGGDAALVALVLLAPTAIAGALVEALTTSCDTAEGLRFLALLPGTGTVLAVGLTLAARQVVGRRGTAGVVGAVFALDLAVALHRLYGEPPIDAHALVFGYWPGSIYDETVPVTAALVAARGLALALAVLAFALAAALDRATGPAARRRALGGAALALAAAAALEGSGEAIGFRRDRGTIEAALSARLERPRFRLFAHPSIGEARLAEFGLEIDRALDELAEFFERPLTGAVRVYLYRDGHEKRALMGGGTTQIARPWAGEIHIDGFELPHGTLKHELAHVFAGEVGRGPFKVPARALVLVNLTLVEGVAVAADWPRDVLSVHEWAKAMHAIGVAPALESILYPQGFWAVSSSRAYTLAGSFLRFLKDTHGAARLLELYASGSFEAAYGRPLAELTLDYQRFLAAVPLPDEARALAEHRMRRAGIFDKTCAHVTARRVEAGLTALSLGELDRAARELEPVLATDPSRTDLLVSLAAASARASRIDEAKALLARAIESEAASPDRRAAALEARGDLAWSESERGEAEVAYRAALGVAAQPAALRTLEAKLEALARPPAVEALLRAYLTGSLAGPRAQVELLELGRLAPNDALVQYLLARRLEASGAAAQALERTEAALGLGLASARMVEEAGRMRARLLGALGRHAEAALAYDALAATARTAGLVEIARDGARRARFLAGRSAEFFESNEASEKNRLLRIRRGAADPRE